MKPQHESEKDWVKVSFDVLAGKFNKVDKSTAQSLVIGLRNNPNEKCKEAVSLICKLWKIKDPTKC